MKYCSMSRASLFDSRNFNRKHAVRNINPTTFTLSKTGKDSFTSSYPSSDAHSLASSHGNLYSSLDSNHGENFSLSEDSYSFTLNPSNIKTNFNVSSFDKRLPSVISDVESVNRADFEENPLYFEPKEFNFGNEFETLVLPGISESTLEDDLSTSSYL